MIPIEEQTCKRVSWLINPSLDYKLGFQNKYFSSIIVNNTYRLVAAHMPSKLYGISSNTRSVPFLQLVDAIKDDEVRNKQLLTVIFGDFNEDPYEMNSLDAKILHGLPSYNDAKRQNRIIFGEEYKMFYNPSWNHLGDESFPPGTYYYASNDTLSTFWHMYDQVLIRPDAKTAFGDFQIITTIDNTDLFDSLFHPNKAISDHFPIVFDLKNGGNNVK